MAFCLEKTFVLNNLGSEDEAVFFWRTVCIEAGSVNKRVENVNLNYTFWGQSRNLGSSENEAVFIEAGFVNKRGEIGVD